jgi:hypothetical protein
MEFVPFDYDEDDCDQQFMARREPDNHLGTIRS